MQDVSFADIAVVSCGTVSLELNHLKKEGFMDRYMEEHTEAFLEYSDWMGIPIQPVPVSLDRFKSLLAAQAAALKDA